MLKFTPALYESPPQCAGTDIEVCNGVLAVAMQGEEVTDPGQVRIQNPACSHIAVCTGIREWDFKYDAHFHKMQVIFYTTYDTTTGAAPSQLYSVSTGPLPDMIRFSPDCTTLVVAIEGPGTPFPAVAYCYCANPS